MVRICIFVSCLTVISNFNCQAKHLCHVNLIFNCLYICISSTCNSMDSLRSTGGAKVHMAAGPCDMAASSAPKLPGLKMKEISGGNFENALNNLPVYQPSWFYPLSLNPLNLPLKAFLNLTVNQVKLQC